MGKLARALLEKGINKKSKGAGIAPLAGTVAGAGALTSQDAEASFIGKAAKLWNAKAAEHAKKRAAEGATRGEIWKETADLYGSPTFKDVDGHWKQEISDKEFIFDPTDIDIEYIQGQPYKVGTVRQGFKKSGQLESYPDLGGSKLVDYDFPSPVGTQGEYRPARSYKALGDMPEEITLWSGDKRSTALHEGQHSIQEREGFAKGGSDKSFTDADLPVNPKYKTWLENQDLAKEAEALRNSPEYTKQLADSNDLWEKEFAPRLEAEGLTRPKRGSENFKQEFEAYQARVRKIYSDYDEVEKKLFPVLSRIDEINLLTPISAPDSKMSKFDAYRRLGGEVEARNVQKRMDMDMPQRVANPPWKTRDVPEDEIIVLAQNNGLKASDAPRIKKAASSLGVPLGLAAMVVGGSMTPRQAKADAELYELATIANQDGDQDLLLNVLQQMDLNKAKYGSKSRDILADKRTDAEKRATGTVSPLGFSPSEKLYQGITKTGLYDETPVGYMLPDIRGLLKANTDYWRGDKVSGTDVALGAAELVPDVAIPYLMKPLMMLGAGAGITGSQMSVQDRKNLIEKQKMQKQFMQGGR